MRRAIAVAVIVLAGFIAPSRAGDGADLMAQVVGEAKAFEELCPKFHINSSGLAELSLQKGVEVEQVSQRDAREHYARTKEAWLNRNPSEACSAGALLYGATGQMAKGVLEE